MSTTRLEAFSDGVLAVIITIMVLEIRRPEGASLAALRPLIPVFVGYTLSFIVLGIYWNNHHHLMHATRRVNGRIMWANLHLLFWVSLVPFLTGWVGEHPGMALPAALYGVDLLMAAIAYNLLVRAIIAYQGRGSELAEAIGKDWKAYLSIALYVLSIVFAFISAWITYALIAIVAAIWFIPDRRIEARVAP